MKSKQNCWFVYWTSDEQVSLQCEKVIANSPRGAVQRFMTKFPKRHLRGMAQSGGLQTSAALPAPVMTATSPSLRRPRATRAQQPFVRGRGNMGEYDLIDRRQDHIRPVY